MKYEGKYKEMAEQFRRDGADKYLIEKFIREEMMLDGLDPDTGKLIEEAADAGALPKGEINPNAYDEWMQYPEDVQQLFLTNALCDNCGEAAFADGYTVRKIKYGLLIEGVCDKCGAPIKRLVEE